MAPIIFEFMENFRMASSLANVKEPARPAVFLDTEDYERFGVFGKGARSDREKRLLEVGLPLVF